jgi:malate dehydrogenase (oxaloacetate-decarboxylating)
VARILLAAGVGDVVVLDSRGIVHSGREDLNSVKRTLAEETNRGGLTGGMGEALDGADVLIGVSGGQIAEESLSGMMPGGMIFALANPTPEVHPELAARHASIVATGRSDYPNQINNVLAFPGIFRGALDAGARRITEGMKLAAATAIADVVGMDLRPDAIVPSPLDPRVAPAVAAAVAEAARREGVCRL